MGFFTKKGIKKNLFYYFGEIIVIVIGIFIAIQLNNWNENRKNEIEEKRILRQVLLDLKTEKYVLEDVKQRMKKNREYLINVRFNSSKKNLDSIYIHLSSIFIHYPMNSEYVNLKSSGKLGLLSNNKLRYNIVNYYEVYYKLYEELEEAHMKKYYDEIQPYFDNEFPSDTTLLMDPNIVAEKLKDKKFKNILVSQIGNYGMSNGYINTSIIDTLINSIKKDTLNH